MSELTLKPAVELLSLLNARAISSVELTKAHTTQIERLDGDLHAFADFDPTRALLQAQDADQRRRRGETGPLLGLPVTVKSSIATAGYRCELGSRLLQRQIAREDALALQRMKSAGAVILGTTTCPEFLMAYETDSLLYGRTANPWNLAHSAGGSSGGEAAAIAAGLSAGGIGSDSGGSVREPAHFTGICSIKPTPGRIPSQGHLAASAGPFAMLGSIGPMARTVRDLELFLEVLARDGSPAMPYQSPYKSKTLSDPEIRSRPIAVLEDDGLVPVTPETRSAVRRAGESLVDQGFRLAPFRSENLEKARSLWWIFFLRCGRMLLEPLIAGREAELSDTFRYFLRVARSEPMLSGEELLSAWMLWEPTRSALLAEMAPYSAILTPVCSIPAFRHGERAWMVEGHSVEYFSAMRFTQWFNFLGAPAAVVPVSKSPDGLPIGVQIAGRPFEDELVLAIAAELDAAFGFQPPPIAVSA